MRNRPRRALARLLLLAVSTLVAVGLAEAGLRVFGRDAPPKYRLDPELGWRRIPGDSFHWTQEGDGRVRINHHGYRGRDRDPGRSPGLRVMAVGDSFTEALQVDLEETFCSLLEDRLSREGSPAEVLNFGVSGYAPLQELLVYRREADRWDPDLVLLCLFPFNDVPGCVPGLVSVPGSPPYAAPGPDGLSIDFSGPEHHFASHRGQPANFLWYHSAIYRNLKRWQGSRGKPGRPEKTPAAAPGGGPVPATHRLYEPGSDYLEEAWRILEEILAALRDECAKRGDRLAVIVFPAGHAVTARGREQLLAEFPGMKDWDLRLPERRLAAMAGRLRLDLLSLGDAFRAEPEEPPLYFRHDGHLTRRGHEVAAEALAAFVRSLGK